MYDGADPDDRRVVHQALASIADQDGFPDRAAWHRAAATVAPDEHVAAACRRSWKPELGSSVESGSISNQMGRSRSAATRPTNSSADTVGSGGISAWNWSPSSRWRLLLLLVLLLRIPTRVAPLLWQMLELPNVVDYAPKVGSGKGNRPPSKSCVGVDGANETAVRAIERIQWVVDPDGSSARPSGRTRKSHRLRCGDHPFRFLCSPLRNGRSSFVLSRIGRLLQ